MNLKVLYGIVCSLTFGDQKNDRQVCLEWNVFFSIHVMYNII